MKYIRISTCILVTAACASCSGAGGHGLRDEADRINYSVGYQVGGDFKSQGVEPRADSMTRGVLDAVSGATPLIPKKEMDATLVDLKKRIVTRQRTEVRKANADFLAENAKRTDVTVLPSGVQLREINPGTGRKPAAGDQVKVQMRISRPDGTVLGSTYEAKMPRTIQISKAMPGLQEALLMMNEGGKYQVVLPASNPSVSREPFDDLGVLVYEIELLSVLPEPSGAAAPGDAGAASN